VRRENRDGIFSALPIELPWPLAIDRSRTCNLSVHIRSNRYPHCVAFKKVSRENRGRYFFYSGRSNRLSHCGSFKILFSSVLFGFVKVLSPGFAPGSRPYHRLTRYKLAVLTVKLREGKWSPGWDLHPEFRFVGPTRSYYVTRAENWRKAEETLPIPQCGTISLAKSPGIACPVNLPENAHDRTCTRTEPLLKRLPLHWATWAKLVLPAVVATALNRV
jgi:hypothetical protein